MVQQVTIPLSWANNIPGVSGIEDVRFDVPELEDIRQEIDEAVPSLPEIEAAVDDVIRTALREVDVVAGQLDGLAEDIADEVDDRLDDLVADIQAEIEAAVADIDVPGLEDVEVDVGGSLFAVNEDFVDLLATALDQVDFLNVDQLTDLEGFVEDVEDVLADVEDLLDTTAAELRDRVVTELRALEEDVPGLTLLLDPEQFIDDQVDRVAGTLASEEALDELREALGDNQ